MDSFSINNYIIFVSSYTLFSFACYLLDTSNILKKIINKRYYMSLSKINSKDIKYLESLYKKYLPRVVFNVVILSYLCGIIQYHFIQYFNPILLLNNTLDTFNPIRAMLEYYLSLFLTEFTFYTCHRITHLPCCYKYIHKKHHEVKNCIGMAAVYTDSLDFFFGNFLPIFFHTSLIMSHQYTFYIWVVKTVYGTIISSHSGYQEVSDYHDIHHTQFKYNYGSGDGYMDKLMGTEYIKPKQTKIV